MTRMVWWTRIDDPDRWPRPSLPAHHRASPPGRAGGSARAHTPSPGRATDTQTVYACVCLAHTPSPGRAQCVSALSQASTVLVLARGARHLSWRGQHLSWRVLKRACPGEGQARFLRSVHHRGAETPSPGQARCVSALAQLLRSVYQSVGGVSARAPPDAALPGARRVTAAWS